MEARKSSTFTVDTEGEQDGHVRANAIGNCPVQPADQLKQKEKEAMVYQHDTHTAGILSIAGMTALWSWSCRVHPVSQAVRWSGAQRRLIQIQ